MELTVRPAQQQRSREAWARVLDAGVAVLSEGGSEGFTIAAVCHRAGVTPPTIYRRAPNKDALFLAVYQHGIEKIRSTEESLDSVQGSDAASVDEVVCAAVDVVARIFIAHQGFLHAVIVISATNATVREHGVEASNTLADLFNRLTDSVTPESHTALRAAVFQMCFGALVLRTGFGADFASPLPVDEEEFIEGLKAVALSAWTRASI
ncbi:TetR/AcrR family transcriptional regulator [Nocardioides insulae]|uniref:TetR/AcrR family transcriptional regulator n=1 Tax=Nocardioides insulae TaxID=394734 RepID=UPI000428B0A5|nr:TetR/AcrR family transcriptional regulator [Nocardioides insulae]